MKVSLSEYVESEGYGFVVATGNELDNHLFTRVTTYEGLKYPYAVVCVADSWDYVYSIAFEIARHRLSLKPGRNKTAEGDAALILAGWCKELADDLGRAI